MLVQLTEKLPGGITAGNGRKLGALGETEVEIILAFQVVDFVATNKVTKESSISLAISAENIKQPLLTSTTLLSSHQSTKTDNGSMMNGNEALIEVKLSRLCVGVTIHRMHTIRKYDLHIQCSQENVFAQFINQQNIQNSLWKEWCS
ncbi:hypothetical protein HAX54_035826 [Datura stramonium]|uniref:Uncharacterized protein n=1 Tax=Datura stramonium TaxID=4076 RepID=A0ABS8RM53_DATST|nr:hypothetical protein [Datura stramonium]